MNGVLGTARSDDGQASLAKTGVSRASPKKRLSEILVVCCVALLGGLLAWWGAAAIPSYLYQNCGFDVWFGADTPRVFQNMTYRGGDHGRAVVHPLFSLLTYPPTKALILSGMAPIFAVKLMLAIIAAGNAALMFSLARRLGVAMMGSGLLTAVFLFSGAFWFWFLVPETYGLGCLTLLIALNLMASQAKPHWLVAVLVCVAAISVTVTNVFSAIVAVAVRFRFKEFIAIGFASVGTVFLLFLVQAVVLTDVSPLRHGVANETDFLATKSVEHADSPLLAPAILVFSTAFAPGAKVQIAEWDGRGPFKQTHVASLLANHSPILLCAGVAWLAALGIGLLEAVKTARMDPMARGLLAVLLFQFGLHQIYGAEHFMYVGHFLPLLVTLIALALRTARAPLVNGLLVVVLMGMVVTNPIQFEKSAVMVRQISQSDLQKVCFGGPSGVSVAATSL